VIAATVDTFLASTFFAIVLTSVCLELRRGLQAPPRLEAAPLELEPRDDAAAWAARRELELRGRVEAGAEDPVKLKIGERACDSP